MNETDEKMKGRRIKIDLWRNLEGIGGVTGITHLMQGGAVHRGIKKVGRELSWRRLNSEFHKLLVLFFIAI